MIDKDFENAKEVTFKKEELDDFFTQEDKNATKIKLAINKEFINALLQKVPDFENIKAKDVIDILYPEAKDEVLFKISTNKICKKLGIVLGKAAKEYEGTIELNSTNKIKISYCEHSLCYKQRFTKAHELGHLFIHLMNGLSVEFKDEKALTASNNKEYKQGNVLAALKIDTSDVSEDQMQYENEANQFARELLLTDDSINYLSKNKGTGLSANKIINYFQISKDTLVKRLKDKDIILGDICTDDIPQLGSTF